MAAALPGRVWLTTPRILGWGLITTLAAAIGWQAPWSPAALWRADLLSVTGDIPGALAHYDAIAHQNPWDELRRAALRRAAVLWWVDKHNGLEARLRWQQIIEDGRASTATRAEAWEHIARLLATSAERPEEAAGAYRMAYETAPEDPRAAQRLVASARAMTDAGHGDEGFQVWNTVARKFASDRALARVAQGQILLSKGSLSMAREQFRDALQAAPAPWIQVIAEEGRDVCERRIERIQSALAAVESTDLPPDLRQRLEAADRAPLHELDNPTP